MHARASANAQRAVRIRATDVHVLAEHRELLCQVTVQLGQVLEARRIDDLPVAPLLERMRAAATQPDVQPVGRGDERVADRVQIRHGLLVRRADARRQLDHALGDFRRDVAGNRLVLDEAKKIAAGFGQIIVMGIDDLHFELDPEGERLRVDKGFE